MSVSALKNNPSGNNDIISNVKNITKGKIMLGRKPSPVNFDALLGPKASLKKLAGLKLTKTAVGARLMRSPGVKQRVKAKLKEIRKPDFSHLTDNKNANPNESALTRFARMIGIENKTLLKAR